MTKIYFIVYIAVAIPPTVVSGVQTWAPLFGCDLDQLSFCSGCIGTTKDARLELLSRNARTLRSEGKGDIRSLFLFVRFQAVSWWPKWKRKGMTANDDSLKLIIKDQA